LGNIILRKENRKNESFSDQNNYIFNYYGIKKALCGKIDGIFGEYFRPKRLLVIQMI
jgi:hypothetical protein